MSIHLKFVIEHVPLGGGQLEVPCGVSTPHGKRAEVVVRTNSILFKKFDVHALDAMRIAHAIVPVEAIEGVSKAKVKKFKRELAKLRGRGESFA